MYIKSTTYINRVGKIHEECQIPLYCMVSNARSKLYMTNQMPEIKSKMCGLSEVQIVRKVKSDRFIFDKIS